MRKSFARLILVTMAVPLFTQGCAFVMFSESGYRRMEEKQQERERKRSERRYERERVARTRKLWRAEIAAAQAENPQALDAQYPGMGWVSGLWCHEGEGGPIVDRLKFMGPGQLRRLSFFNFEGTRPESDLIWNYTLRLKGDTVEVWDSTPRTASLVRWRKGPKGELIIAGGARYDKSTAKRPFSGKVTKEFDGKTVFRRCTWTVDAYLRLKREK